MRLITLSLIFVTLIGGLAFADRDSRRDRRDDRRDHRDNRRDNVRDRRGDHRDRVRVRRQRYRGSVRADRRRIDRRPLYVNNGRVTFHNGRTWTYTRPIIRDRYYNFRVRPQIIVETAPAQYGYIWVSGAWNWNGSEWLWAQGHYEADPAFGEYYDDGSYTINAEFGEEYD
jgi:hypothetical protein